MREKEREGREGGRGVVYKTREEGRKGGRVFKCVRARNQILLRKKESGKLEEM